VTSESQRLAFHCRFYCSFFLPPAIFFRKCGKVRFFVQFALKNWPSFVKKIRIPPKVFLASVLLNDVQRGVLDRIVWPHRLLQAKQ
jgi:hypothetical protein